MPGHSVAAVAGKTGVLVLAHLSERRPTRFLTEVDPEACLEAGDRLIVCGEPRTVSNLLAGGKGDAEEEPLWAGLVRRLSRVVHRTLSEIDTAVLVCSVVLLVVIAASSIILQLGVDKYTFTQALFRTVSIMATGADMHEEDFGQGMKVYVVVLRLVGAALLAAFTAIFTNYLLRLNSASALEVRRIPDGGHILVCGLGPVGFRVVEELTALKEPVVVVEMAPDNPFLGTVRRLGAAVVIGNASVSEVLRQANASTARAVIAATNNDLVNLEVALLVRELNPNQRVVLLQSDPQLAQMLRDGANVRLAVSVPVLAAPAFVAGLFGDRVQSVFLIGGRLLAVIDLVVGEQDTVLKGRLVRQVAADNRLFPAAVLTAKEARKRSIRRWKWAIGSSPSSPCRTWRHCCGSTERASFDERGVETGAGSSAKGSVLRRAGSFTASFSTLFFRPAPGQVLFQRGAAPAFSASGA